MGAAQMPTKQLTQLASGIPETARKLTQKKSVPSLTHIHPCAMCCVVWPSSYKLTVYGLTKYSPRNYTCISNWFCMPLSSPFSIDLAAFGIRTECMLVTLRQSDCRRNWNMWVLGTSNIVIAICVVITARTIAQEKNESHPLHVEASIHRRVLVVTSHVLS